MLCVPQNTVETSHWLYKYKTQVLEKKKEKGERRKECRLGEGLTHNMSSVGSPFRTC